MKVVRLKCLIYTICLIGCSLLGFVGCSAIDEDRSDCASTFKVKYSVRLKTNLATEIQTELRNRFEDEIADTLEKMMKNIFREYADDVDLTFYINNALRRHEQHIMDNNQATYTVELPADDYRHLAMANVAREKTVKSEHVDLANTSYLFQEGGDIIQGHNTGLFTARKNMDVKGNVDQTFDVTLYMVNSASILVIRTDGVAYNDCQVYSTDFACGFFLNDSTYNFSENPQIHDIRLTRPPVYREVYYAVSFPTHDTAEAAHAQRAGGVQQETGSDDANRIWRKFVYVTLPDGSVTRTVVNIPKALQAGQVMILYAYMKPDGSIYSPNVQFTTSVQLNWKQGLHIEN